MYTYIRSRNMFGFSVGKRVINLRRRIRVNIHSNHTLALSNDTTFFRHTHGS